MAATKFYIDSATNRTMPTFAAQYEKEAKLTADTTTNTLTWNVPGGTSDGDWITCVESAGPAHNHVDWPSTGWSYSFDISTTVSTLTYLYLVK